MADLDEAAEGLMDAFAQLDKQIPKEYSDELKKAYDLYKSGEETLATFTERFRFLTTQVQNLVTLTPDLIAKFAELSVAVAAQKNKAVEFGSALDKATSGITAFTKAASATTGEALLTGAIDLAAGSAKKLGAVLTGVEGSFAVIAGPLATVAGGFAALAVTVGAVVVVSDAAAKAQRGMVESLLQTGIGADKLRWGLGTTVDAVLKAGTEFGYTQDEVGSLAKGFSEAGIAVRNNKDRLSDSTLTQKSYEEAVKLSTAMSRAYGSDLGTTGEIVQRLGTQFMVAGKDMEPAIGTFLKAQHESGVQFGAFAKVNRSVSDSLRNLGSGFDEALGITSKWSKELIRGTVSAAELSSVYDSQAGSFEKQLQNMMMVRNFDRAGAAAIGITGGNQFENLYKFQKAQETVAGQGMIAQSYANLARQNGGPREQQIEIFKNLMETQLGFKTTIENIEKMFNNPALFPKVKSEAEKASPEERVAQMFKEAASAVTKFGTSGENLNKSVVSLTSSVNSLRDHIDDIEEVAAHPLKGVGDYWADKIKGVFEVKPGEVSVGRRYGTAGVNEGIQAPERTGAAINRQPQGTISITMGDTHVAVQGHDKEALGRALDEAHEKTKKEVMAEIESQWQRAQYAQ